MVPALLHDVVDSTGGGVTCAPYLQPTATVRDFFIFIFFVFSFDVFVKYFERLHSVAPYLVLPLSEMCTGYGVVYYASLLHNHMKNLEA